MFRVRVDTPQWTLAIPIIRFNWKINILPKRTMAAGPARGSSINIPEILETLRRGWRYPVYGCLIGLAVASTYVVLAKVPYKSSARILIDRSVNRYLQTNKIIDQPTFDEV